MSDEAAVLARIKREVVGLFGEAFAADAIRDDVDVFEGTEPLVDGYELDSMDLIAVLDALEELFDVPLASELGGEGPMTLRRLAGRIAELRP